MPRKTVERISAGFGDFLGCLGGVLHHEANELQEKLVLEADDAVGPAVIRMAIRFSTEEEGCTVLFHDQSDSRADRAMIFRDGNALASVTITNYAAHKPGRLLATFDASCLKNRVAQLP